MKALSALVSFLFVVLSSSVFAQWVTPIEDPRDLLQNVDTFVGTVNFESQFQCGSKATYFTPVLSAELYCEGGISTASAEWSGGDAEVLNCSSESASIYYSNGKIWDLTKEIYQSNHQNAARLFLMNFSNFIGYDGTLKITAVEKAQYKVPDTEKIFAAQNISGEFLMAPGCEPHPFLITVLQGTPGVAQIARVRLDDTTWIRLKGF